MNETDLSDPVTKEDWLARIALIKATLRGWQTMPNDYDALRQISETHNALTAADVA